MGHRLSKSTVNKEENISFIEKFNQLKQRQQQELDSIQSAYRQQQEVDSIQTATLTLPSTSSTSSATSATGRSFVIKIQFTKMIADEEIYSTPSQNDGATLNNLNNNLNCQNQRPQILNLPFPRNIPCDPIQNGSSEMKLNNLNRPVNSPVMVNNNFVSNFSTAPYIDDDNNSSGEISPTHFQNNLNQTVQRLNNCNVSNLVLNNHSTSQPQQDYQDVPDINQRIAQPVCKSSDNTKSSSTVATTMCANHPDQKQHCCRRKKTSSTSHSSSAAYQSKWRCCKCACRDAVKKIVDPRSPSTSSCSNVESKAIATRPNSSSWASRFSCSKKDNQDTPDLEVQSSAASAIIPAANAAVEAVAAATSPPLATAGQNHLAIWRPSEVLFPISTRPGEIFVLRIEDLDERQRRLRAIEIEGGDMSAQMDPTAANAPWHPIICAPNSGLSLSQPGGTLVHSQIDFIHCLVPDLEKITSSSFYWGKMDRYEAERLLDGKPEGTFLLRDSAQEEYLFSVTFRKYGRSLHARIEQYNHKFSFDCHDPGVFTAPTVTGLLEHYKDPSCVMFFEPMLTIPLNRNFTFSLQQLCRATIVSSISYDGISELQLPNSLKGYLKEYHYKMQVRKKSFDEPFYSCS